MATTITKSILFLALLCYGLSARGGDNKGKLNIIVDERMELLTTIQYLSGYPILTQAGLEYKREIDEYFKAYKGHAAVLLNKQVYRRFFGFDRPVVYLYHFSFPEMEPVAEIPQRDMEDYGFALQEDTLAMLRRQFRDFYEVTKFHQFYLAHKDFYDSLTGPAAKKLAETRAIETMEKHYGMSNKEYYVVLSPLLHDGGYGPQVATKQGNMVYAIIGPKYDSKDFPEFDLDNLLAEYVLHEFSHSFCNPLVSRYFAEIKNDSCLLEPIRASQEEQGYGEWETCVAEHVVRANEILLTEKILGKAKADELYRDMVSNGQWIYLEGLVPLMRTYSLNRQQYKTFKEFMPLVAGYFHEQAAKCR